MTREQQLKVKNTEEFAKFLLEMSDGKMGKWCKDCIDEYNIDGISKCNMQEPNRNQFKPKEHCLISMTCWLEEETKSGE